MRPPAPRADSRTVRTAAVLRCLCTTLLASGLLSHRAEAQTPPRRVRASDVDTIPVRDAGRRIAYGADSLQFGELRVPAGRGPFPIAIVIHGGCWFSPYASARNTAPLAQALTDAGWATWNVEYRRYDQAGGGWPGTFLDIAAAADALRAVARTAPLDTTRIFVTGHSAGAQLALWLPTRARLHASSALASGKPIAIAGVVSIGGISDLREFYARERSSCGNPAVESLLGAVPDSVPDRVRDASPIERLPLGVPSIHVSGARDAIATRASVESFAERARAAGDSVELVFITDEGHFESIMPAREGGRAVIDAMRRLLASHAMRTNKATRAKARR